MNNSNPLFDELVTSFRELKSFQGADEIRSILLEFVSPQLIERGFVHFKHYPEEWWNTRVLIEEQVISDPRPGSERIYKILTIPYRGENQILLDENSGPPLPERLQIMTKQVEDCLELAGQTLLDDPASQRLPIEITGVKNPIQAWLMFLHYITKPERITWERVNRIAVMGKIFGVADIDKGDFGEPNMDSFSTVGKFSFNPLQDNSFSVVRDIATSSIRAVRMMQQGLIEEAKPPVTEEQEVPEQKTFKPADLKNITKLSDESVRQYLISSGIPRAGRGQSNYEYPESDVITFINHVLSQSISSLSRNKCEAFLQSRRSQT